MQNYIIANYWLQNQFGGKGNIKLWDTFEHNGVLFPPDFERINVPIIYEGKEILLNADAEEAATFYAKYLETEYIKNPKFNKNFWKDFKPLLDPRLGITEFEKCDFTLIKKHLDKKREERMAMSKEQCAQIKENNLKKEEKYTVANVNGKEQKVGNFRVEPPGIFLGRGCHPKLGKIKKRIRAEDITINIGKDAKVPEGNWKEVIHNNKVIWLASWKENVLGKTKYVWLSDKSEFKSQSDIKKFDLARKLKRKIGEIRKVNCENLKSDDIKKKQLATTLYFIDKLALRVGNEKGKNEADTVGISSLRIEHLQLLGNNKIKLDFLGKDSIRYVKKFEIDPIVYQNLSLFISDKNKKDQLFDKISPSDINKYLQGFMKNLTSKVFRTMNASKLFQRELKKITSKFDSYENDDKVNLLLDEFNKANAKVALLCNHQKSVSKNFKNQIDKIKKYISELRKKKKGYELKKQDYKERGKRDSVKRVREQIKKIDSKILKYKSKKNLKIELKSVSLGTSKVNYIDPRITVAFAKKHNIDIDRLLLKTLQDKFEWAMDTPADYKF